METIRTHRVGSVTTGLSMIAFGILFIIHLFFGTIGYDMIFRLWPFILVGLGVEILISNAVKDKFVYDKGAIFLLIMVSLFAMCMAGAEMIFNYFKDFQGL